MKTGQELTFTNPARRLHEILSEADTMAKAGPGDTIRHYLAAKLGGSGDDTVAMQKKFNGLMDLVFQTDECIGRLNHKRRATFGKSIEPILNGLRITNLDQHIGGLVNGSNQGTLEVLELAADALDEEQPESLLGEDLLTNLNRAVSELRLAIETLAPPALKAILLRRVAEMERALWNYKLTGAEGLERAVSQAFGTAIVEAASIVPEKDNPILKQFWDVTGKINAAVAIAKHATNAGSLGAATVEKVLQLFS